jgi:hypothetical protein
MKTNTTNALAGVLILSLVVLMLALSSVVSIWSINTLFGLSVAYNVWTCCAAVWLQTVVLAPKIVSKAKG